MYEVLLYSFIPSLFRYICIIGLREELVVLGVVLPSGGGALTYYLCNAIDLSILGAN
jgi:hypothetical protein